MKRYVSEIFGYPPSNTHKEATILRSKCLCPFYSGFSGGVCDPVNKKSNLTDDKGKPLITHQSGACSVLYTHRKGLTDSPIIICPYRFYEKNDDGKFIAFEYIKKKFFKEKNTIFVPEIGLGAYGRADGILCELEKKDAAHFVIPNYAHLEFQADATTGTRELVLCVKDFFDGEDITKNNYGYGLNSKASIKGSSLQMIDKGYLFDHLGKKSLWIIQDCLFDILCEIYNVKMTDITDIEPKKGENLIFVVFKLVYSDKKQRYVLTIDKVYSTTPANLQDAISKKVPIEERVIMESVLSKISSKMYYNI